MKTASPLPQFPSPVPRSRFVREVLESLLDYVKLLFMVVIMARFAWVLLVSLLLHLSLLEAVSTWGGLAGSSGARTCQGQCRRQDCPPQAEGSQTRQAPAPAFQGIAGGCTTEETCG